MNSENNCSNIKLLFREYELTMFKAVFSLFFVDRWHGKLPSATHAGWWCQSRACRFVRERCKMLPFVPLCRAGRELLFRVTSVFFHGLLFSSRRAIILYRFRFLNFISIYYKVTQNIYFVLDYVCTSP